MLAIAAAATSHGARSTRMAEHAIAKHRLRDCQSGAPPPSLALCWREVDARMLLRLHCRKTMFAVIS
jgi:hypothetical protein